MHYYPPGAGDREQGLLLARFRRRFRRQDGYLICRWHTLEFCVLPCEDCGLWFPFLRTQDAPQGVRGGCLDTEDEALRELFTFCSEQLDSFLDKLREEAA
jgi:hypothetical protein